MAHTADRHTADRKAGLRCTAPILLSRFAWLAVRAMRATGTDRVVLDAQATLASRYAVRAIEVA